MKTQQRNVHIRVYPTISVSYDGMSEYPKNKFFPNKPDQNRCPHKLDDLLYMFRAVTINNNKNNKSITYFSWFWWCDVVINI